MPIIARKISRAKWHKSPSLAEDEIPADAVTSDLRTTGNAVSFWACNSPSQLELENVALALAAASDRLDKIDIAWVEEDEARTAGLSLNRTPGDTPVAVLRHYHVDIERLDYTRLGILARLVASGLDNNQHKRMTKKEVAALVLEAVRKKLVDPEELREDVRREVERGLRPPDSGPI